MVGDFVSRPAGLLQHRPRFLVKRARRVVVREREVAAPVRREEGRAPLDRQLVERQVLPGERERAAQLLPPGGESLSGPGVDQVEGHAGEARMGRLHRRDGLARVVAAPQEAQRRVVQRLHAEGDAPDPGGAEPVEPGGLDGGGVGLQRRLQVRPGRPQPPRRAEDRLDGAGVHQRGRAAAEEHARQPPAGNAPRHRLQLPQQRAAPAAVVDRAGDMAVEVAIRAFREAERPVHIKRERAAVRALPAGAARRHGAGPSDRASSFAKASARWLTECFQAGSASPNVLSLPRGRKIGS